MPTNAYDKTASREEARARRAAEKHGLRGAQEMGYAVAREDPDGDTFLVASLEEFT